VILGRRAVLFTWKVPLPRRGQDLRQALFSQAKALFTCKRSRPADHWRKLEASRPGADMGRRWRDWWDALPASPGRRVAVAGRAGPVGVSWFLRRRRA
jgi:hypothetical protein